MADECGPAKVQPCAEGTECVLEVCEHCSVCAAGKYKDSPGAHPCRDCPSNTYNPFTNAKDFASCRACPPGSDTSDLSGQTRAEACRCGVRYYLADPESSGAAISCAICPVGLECRDGSCAIQSSLDVDRAVCKDGSVSMIKGDWISSQSLAVLVSCPIGHRLVNQTGSKMQKCEECADGKFMLDSRKPGLECQPCPPQGFCPNKGPPVFNVLPLQSTMMLQGDLNEAHLGIIIKSIAESLGVDSGMVECDGFDQLSRRQVGRRAPVSMTFKVYVDSEQKNKISDLIQSDRFSELLADQLDHNDVMASVDSVGKVQVNTDKEASVGTVALVDGTYQLVDCPRGYLLVNDTIPGSCLTCERGTYSIDPFEGCSEACSVRLCNECPEGADCSGGQDRTVENHFQPRHGTWTVEPTNVTDGRMLRYRLSSCDAGYKLIRSEASSYTRDKCEKCEFGKLALSQAFYHPIHAEAGRLDTCVECKELVGIECQGGMKISPSEGFWIDPMLVLTTYSNVSMFDPGFNLQKDVRNMTRTTIRVDDSIFAYFEKEDGNRSDLTRFGTVIEFEEGKQFASVKFLGQDQPVIIASAWIQQRALRAHQCAPEACLADWTCRPGHFGRLCGLCIDSYVMSTEGCVPCAVSQDDIWKVTTGCVVISLLIVVRNIVETLAAMY